MDPITILTIAIPLAIKAFGAAKASGLIGEPEWVKYADVGTGILMKAVEITQKIQSGNTDYDHLTADEIEALLKPLTWDEIEAKAKAGL